jgi:dihydropteroate synthase
MGILNLTPDSFSDGGQFLDPSAALDQALKLGSRRRAHILDCRRPIHPVRGQLNPSLTGEELRRLLPVLDRWPGG